MHKCLGAGPVPELQNMPRRLWQAIGKRMGPSLALAGLCRSIIRDQEERMRCAPDQGPGQSRLEFLALVIRHSRESGNLSSLATGMLAIAKTPWIPAFAGMTVAGKADPTLGAIARGQGQASLDLGSLEGPPSPCFGVDFHHPGKLSDRSPAQASSGRTTRQTQSRFHSQVKERIGNESVTEMRLPGLTPAD